MTEPTAEDNIWEYCQIFDGPPPGPGRTPATWHEPEFMRVDELIATGMSKRDAIAAVVKKREHGPHVSPESFATMYERHEQRRLWLEAGDAIVRADQPSFVEAFARLTARAMRCGRPLSGETGKKVPKKPNGASSN